MGFIRRQIGLKFRLGTGSFGETGQNTVTIAPGLRVSATISKAGGAGLNVLQARIYGLDPTIANQISTLGTIYGATRNNLITLSAGDAGGVLGVAFIGTIDLAWSDYNDAPDAALVVHAYTGLIESTRPIPPTSFNGSADVATIIASIAQQMGIAFENSGVSVQLHNQYLSGTGREQAYAAAASAGVNIVIDDQPNATKTIAIWPKGGARGAQAPLLSPDTGMVGYPVWEENALTVKSVYNPSLSTGAVGTAGLMVGGTVNVQSSIKNASGSWQVFNLQHDLESETPDGAWFTTVRCNSNGAVRAPGT